MAILHMKYLATLICAFSPFLAQTERIKKDMQFLNCINIEVEVLYVKKGCIGDRLHVKLVLCLSFCSP